VCELGKRLRAAREAKGLELEEAARRVGIRRSYLEALEACRFDELPEPALARAHLRRLAKALGLDADELVALYPHQPEPVPYAPLPERRRRRGWVWLLFIPAALLFVWLALRRPPPPAEAEPPPPPPPAPQEAEAPKRVRLAVATEPEGAKVYLDGYYLGRSPVELEVEAGTRVLRIEAEGYLPLEQTLELQGDERLHLRLSPKPKPKAEAPPPEAKGKLVLRVTDRSWLRVTTPEGKKLYERTAEPGTELVFDLPVVVKTGNAGGVRVVLEGKDQGPMGKPGEVLTKRFPSE